MTRSTSAAVTVAELGGDAHRVTVLLAGPGDGVLAPAAADHQHPSSGQRPLEAELGLRLLDRDRVATGEAGVAVALDWHRRRASCRRATGRPGCRRRSGRASPSTVSRAAIRSPSWPMSTPKWQAWVIGGHVIRRWTSVAPASRTSLTSGPAVVPRTSESSIMTTRLPARFSARALNFSATPRSRMSWVGSMNVRPM